MMPCQPAPLELASDAARVRGLYKLLPLPPLVRVLEIVSEKQTPVLFDDYPRSGTQLISANIHKFGYCDIGCKDVKTHSPEWLMTECKNIESYDLIILHGTFSQFKTKLCQDGYASCERDIFRALNRLLDNTGILAGCFANNLSLRNLLSPSFKNQRHSGLSLFAMQKGLNAGGFGKPRIFSLYPGMMSPITLAEVNQGPSVAHSRAQITYLRNWLGKPNYWLKMLLSLVGTSLWFEDEYFFYAPKS